MDSRREHILILLSICRIMKYVIVGILALQRVAIFEHNIQMMMIGVFLMDKHWASSQRTCWKWQHYGGFLDCTLLGSGSEEVFRKQCQLNLSTFKYLCNLLEWVLGKKNTHFKNSILVQCRVAIILYYLGSGNTLIVIADLFGLGESTTSIIVRECCEAIRILLKSLVFKRLTLVWMKKIAAEFEALHGIPLIIEAIDGSHIPIIAPIHDLVSYYCQKEFYSYLLQEVVDSKCKFWDYGFGWCRRIHDWALFQKTEIGKKNHERCISSFQIHW